VRDIIFGNEIGSSQMKEKLSKRYSIGVDYGTNSVRALIVDTSNGKEIGTNVYNYPSGKDGIILDSKDPNLARQNPADYIKGFVVSVKGALIQAKKVKGFSAANVVGIGVDTTGSTPIPVDKQGKALALSPKFKNNPAAHAWLWKDHTGHEEAAKITDIASRGKFPYLAKCGGTYSPEWFWSKIWHCQNTAPVVFKAAYSWVELCDFVPAYITGNTDPLKMARSVCAAGHKAMYNEQWKGLPSKTFLRKLSPELAKLRDRLYDKAVPSNEIAGYLTDKVAKQVGLSAGIAVAVGAFDAHHGAVGAGIKEGTLVKIIGTSSCDILVSPEKRKLKDIPGVCGIVPGSVIPGMYGLEAGQSAVGDIFNWFVTNLCPSEFSKGDKHVNLTKAAAKMKPGENGLIALDWNNGNRTVLVDPLLSGLLVGQTLHTTAPEIYRALVEATAFGALTIINRFEKYNAQVKEVVNCGGIAEKNGFVMQIYADICNRPMKVSRSAQTCALGAAIFGSVAASVYPNTAAAAKKMTGVKTKVYKPIKSNVQVYAKMYKIYMDLHDAFGTNTFKGKLNCTMKELIAIRNKARKG
jgi:L-ribulokinase